MQAKLNAKLFFFPNSQTPDELSFDLSNPLVSSAFIREMLWRRILWVTTHRCFFSTCMKDNFSLLD